MKAASHFFYLGRVRSSHEQDRLPALRRLREAVAGASVDCGRFVSGRCAGPLPDHTNLSGGVESRHAESGVSASDPNLTGPKDGAHSESSASPAQNNLPVAVEDDVVPVRCRGRQSFLQLGLSRDGEAVSRQAHNLKMAGSTPAPATRVKVAAATHAVGHEGAAR